MNVLNSISSVINKNVLIDETLQNTPDFNFPAITATKHFHIDAYNPLNTNKYYENESKNVTLLKELATGNDAIPRNPSNIQSSIELLSNGFRDKPTIVFPTYTNDNSLRRITGNLLPFTGSPDMTLFIVASSNCNTNTALTGLANQSVARLFSCSSSDGQDDFNNIARFGYLKQGANTTGFGVYRNGSFTAGNNPPLNNFETIWFGQTQSSVMTSSFLNGDATIDRTTTTTATNYSFTFFTVGSNTNRLDTPSFFSGKISEILLFKGALSNSDRQKVEGYLAWKWNLVDRLPNSHIYKTSYP